MKKGLAGIILLLLSVMVLAQEVKFQASANQTVSMGDQFKLVFSVNKKVQDIDYPNLKDFNILSGPAVSSNSSIQIINGNMSRTEEYTYTFYLSPKKEGTFNIGSALATINGKDYSSNPLQINVIKGHQKQQEKNQYGIGKEDIFLKATATNTNPYLGEQTIVTYKLYFKVQVEDLMNPQLSTFPGFWAKSLLEDGKKFKQYVEYVNGSQYYVAEIAKLALFPQKSGKLSIDPKGVDAIVQVKDNSRANPYFSPFFFNYKNIEVPVKSNALSFNVKSLPSKGKPAEFTNAVGNFSLESSIDLQEVKTNEPITLRYKLSGSGNIDLAEVPDVQFPPDFTVYEPKINQKINRTANGISGTKIIEYLLLPRNPGDYTLPSLSFSYFDVNKNSYVKLSTPSYDIHVEKGEGQDAMADYSGVNREEIQYIGSDIRYIHTSAQLKPFKGFFIQSPWYIVLLLLPVVLFISGMLIWRKELKKRSNLSLMKYRKATGLAKKRMKKAYAVLQQNDLLLFYEETSKALWGYMSDKLSIPVSDLSIDTLSASLQNHRIDQKMSDEIIRLIDQCELARFAPGDHDVTPEDIYHHSLDVIRKLEKELRS